MIAQMQAAIFDLDGVLVDTTKYHFLAWQRLTLSLGFDFSIADNERLKGVSRARSLEILLEIGGLSFDEKEKTAMAAKKNEWYREFIHQLDASAILPGADEYLRNIRSKGVKTALGSASKNAPLILERLGITTLFDVIIDGNSVTHSKPNPEGFLLAARELEIPPESCVVFEDAEAGIEAAHRAGMAAVGIGKPEILFTAEVVISGLSDLLVLGL